MWLFTLSTFWVCFWCPGGRGTLLKVSWKLFASLSPNNISAAWGGGSGVFGIFFDFFGPGPLKNASEKIALRSFCPDFRAENSHGEPNRAWDNFPEKWQKCYFFLQKHDFNIFWRNRSLIRPLSLEPRRKMTAIGLSSYQLFTKTLNFDRQNLNFPSVFDIFGKEYVRFYEKVTSWF